MRAGTVDDLRGFILRVTLPAALFLAFLRVELEPTYGVIVVSVFTACVAVLAIAPMLRRAAGIRAASMPDLMAGFEAGMLGYALFGTIFGAQELYHFAIVDIGQVLFVFFILAPVVTMRASGQRLPLRETAAAFVRTPVILAILGGLAGSVLGLGEVLEGHALGRSVVTTLELLAALTTPLIAIVLGYSTTLRSGSLRDPVRTLVVRLPIWIALGLAFSTLVVRDLLGLDRLFEAAVMTMAVLPPPFVVPLYMARATAHDIERDPEHTYVVNSLSLATLVTLGAFVLVGVAYAS